MKARLLYETNSWLNKDSRRLIGVFTSDHQFNLSVIKYIRMQVRNNVYSLELGETKREGVGRIYDKFLQNGNQTQEYSVNLYSEEVECNILI